MDRAKWKRWGVICVTSGFYTGYFPIASGTIGTLVGVGLVWCLKGVPLFAYLVITALVFALAVWSCGEANRLYSKSDSSRIVIDEIVGYMVTMVGIPVTAYWVIFGFVLFRFFDIVKLPPANYFDSRLKNGLGVVLDDVTAGVFANVLLHLAIRSSF